MLKHRCSRGQKCTYHWDSESSYPSTFVDQTQLDVAYDAYAVVVDVVPLVTIVDGCDVDVHADVAQAGVWGPSKPVASDALPFKLKVEKKIITLEQYLFTRD